VCGNETASHHGCRADHRASHQKLPAIYAGGFVVSIKNAPEELLAWVNDWVAQPKYVYRHKWRLHDLVFWDNRRVMHHATPYPETQRRHMHRTTIKGSAPYLDRQYLARALSSTP